MSIAGIIFMINLTL